MRFLKTRSFKWWEISLLKVCLISLGILIGLYFFDYVVEVLWLWWILFVALAVYFIVRFFQKK